jgi:hypothetical protein
MKFINHNRSDDECLKTVIKYTNLNDTYKCEKIKKKEIENLKKSQISQIRYIDNQIRIYEARKNWKILRCHILKTLSID